MFTKFMVGRIHSDGDRCTILWDSLGG